LSDKEEESRDIAVRRLKVVVPGLFAVGFMFYVAITVFPLAGMPLPPLSPFGATGSLLPWLAIACASGGVLALFGALVVAFSASAEGDA
jgi:hypothetical protein